MAVSGQGTGIYVFSAQADALTGITYVKHIRWVGATTAGHTLTVTDTAGNVILYSIADGNYFIDIHPFYRYFTGIVVASMGSGALYVYTNNWGVNK
jgi:hypothetical protein